MLWASYLKGIALSSVLIRGTNAALSYCASANTGTFQTSSIYMSNGLCHDECAGFALAIVQYQNCYCSDFLPSDTGDLGECNTECPGFPSELCGGDNVFGYIYLSEPSGTIGDDTTSTTTSTSNDADTTTSSTTSSTTAPPTSSTTSSSTTSTSTTSSSTTTSSTTSSSTTSSSTTSSSTTSSTSTSTTSSSTTSSSTSSQTTEEETTTSSSSSSSSRSRTSTITSSIPTSSQSSSSTSSSTEIVTSIVYSISTLTQNESTRFYTTAVQTTITIQPSETPSDSLNLSRETSIADAPQSKDTFWDHKGKVAGVFTAVGVVLLGLILLLIWLLFRCCARDRNEDEEEDDVIPADGQGGLPIPPLVSKAPYTINIASHNGSSNASGRAASTSPNKPKFVDLTDEDLSSTEETVINEKQHNPSGSISNSSTQVSGLVAAANSLGPGPATGGNNGAKGKHIRNVSIISTDFGIPIIDNNGESTYVDQRLDVGRFDNINENDEILSLNDNQDYSRRVFRVTNPDPEV